MKRISFIAISGVLMLSASAAYAAYEFQGPQYQPTSGNVPGVIWNVDGTSAVQPNAKINFGQNSDGSSHPGGANYKSDVGFTSGRAIRVDNGASASTLNMGNWGSGQQPFTFNIYGDLKMNGFAPGGSGRKGQIDAEWYCIAGTNCINAWPSGGGGLTTISVGTGLTVTNPTGPTATIGLTSSCASGQMLKWDGTKWVCSADNNSGGTLTGITAGTGATISGSAPSPTINVTDQYVNTTGDTMTGKLILNWPGYRALEINGGNGGSGAIYGYNNIDNGYGGEFYGAYGVYATTPNTNKGFYAGYFSGYSGGVNAIGSMAGGVGIHGQNAGTGSYGVRGTANSGYGGLFMDSTYYSYVGGQGYGVLSNAQLYTSASGYFGGSVTIQNPSSLCLGGVCRNTWPAAGSPGGANTQIQYNSSGAFAGSSNLIWDNANTRMTVNKTFNVNVPGTYSSQLIAEEGIKSYNSLNLADGYAHCAGDFRSVAGPTVWLGCRQMGAYISGNGYSVDLANSLYAISAIGTSSLQRVNTNGYGIYTSGGVVDLGTAPNTASNVLIPSTGGIGFDGNRDNTAFLQLWSNDNFYWDLGAGGHLYIRASGGVTKFDLDASTGNAYKSSGAGSWLAYSDKRLKDSLGSYKHGLDDILNIDPVDFKYKADNTLGLNTTEEYTGVIAQDLQKIIPEAVKLAPNGYLTVENDRIIWASVNAIKELKAENDKLKTQNESLEWRLKVLESKMDTLMAR